jgi:acyl dehydratase
VTGASFVKIATVPVNPELLGRVFPPTEPYLVGREKIREFSRAVFATSPLNHDPAAARAAGYQDVVGPPSFAIVIQESTLAQLLAEPDAGIDFARVVHGDQRFSYTRPIVAGDELTATLTVASIKSLGGHSMVTAESTIVDASGAHVVTATSTLVVRGDA